MTSERGYLQNRTVPWSDAVVAHGEDPDRVLETLARDAQRFREKGLPVLPGIPDPSKAAGAGQQGTGDGGRGTGKEAGKKPDSQASRSAHSVQRVRYPGQPRGPGGRYGEGKLSADTGGGTGGGGKKRAAPATAGKSRGRKRPTA